MANILAATPLQASGYQVGLGPNTSTSKPVDLYLAVNTTAATISPLTDTLVINASGTMTAVTVNLPANAAPGQRLSIFANQAVSTLTLTPATSTQNTNGIADVVSSALTALTQNVGVEYQYQLQQATSTTGTPTTATNLYTWYRVR